jgi:hypothetical protein
LRAGLVNHVEDPTWIAVAPDGKTVYYSAYLDHVRRQVIADFGARPRPPAP